MIIKSSTALRNNYGDISALAHAVEEPIYITKNGEGDLVVMSIEAFEKREQLIKLRAKLEVAEQSRLAGDPAICLDEAEKVLGKTGETNGFLQLDLNRSKIEQFCQKYHIRKLSMFGSTLRGELRPESDVDILVEFDLDHVPSLFQLVVMEEELSPLFGSRKVDLRTPKDLSRYFRDEVVRDAEVLYLER